MRFLKIFYYRFKTLTYILLSSVKGGSLFTVNKALATMCGIHSRCSWNILWLSEPINQQTSDTNLFSISYIFEQSVGFWGAGTGSSLSSLCAHTKPALGRGLSASQRGDTDALPSPVVRVSSLTSLKWQRVLQPDSVTVASSPFLRWYKYNDASLNRWHLRFNRAR